MITLAASSQMHRGTGSLLRNNSGTLEYYDGSWHSVGTGGTGTTLNGTGFVVMSGTSVSYDNSTYLTTSSAASTYQPLDADLTTFAGITATTVGQNLLQISNPSAIRFIKINADNTVSARTAAEMLSDISAQASDADLTTIAGLTATTDNFIVSVSSAWASRTPAQVRTTLALVIGTNVQAWDTDLDTWATKTAPSGTVLGTSDAQTLTNKRITKRVTAISSNATWSPSADNDDVYEITAQAAAVTTISNPSGTPTDGQTLIIRAKCDASNRALSWSGSQWRAGTDIALPTTLTANKTMYLQFMYNSADTKWDLISKIDGF